MIDPIIDWLQKNGFPVNRQTYLEISYMGDVPDEIDAEVEADLEELGLSEDSEEIV